MATTPTINSPSEMRQRLVACLPVLVSATPLSAVQNMCSAAFYLAAPFLSSWLQSRSCRAYPVYCCYRFPFCRVLFAVIICCITLTRPSAYHLLTDDRIDV